MRYRDSKKMTPSKSTPTQYLKSLEDAPESAGDAVSVRDPGICDPGRCPVRGDRRSTSAFAKTPVGSYVIKKVRISSQLVLLLSAIDGEFFTSKEFAFQPQTQQNPHNHFVFSFSRCSSNSTTFWKIFITEAGLRDMDSMPSLTRNSANSG